MLRKLSLTVSFFLALVLFMPLGRTTGLLVPQIVGVWTCTVIRSGTIARPLMYTFHADGTMDYVSSTTINNTTASCQGTGPGCSPVFDSGFHSRAGSRGEWYRTGRNSIVYDSFEFIYDENGNAAGTFAVHQPLVVTQEGQLCTGNATVCPGVVSSISLSQWVFQSDVDSNITGLNYLLPPGSASNVLCNRLNSGDGFPGLPTPES